MSQYFRDQLVEDRDKEECSEPVAFSKRVARAISNRVDRFIQAEDAKTLLMDTSKSNLLFPRQQDETEWVPFSEAPRWTKPLFSPETATALRQKLTK